MTAGGVERAGRVVNRRAFLLGVCLATMTPTPADAQFTRPCDLGCALTLGASSLVFATGTATAVGRLEGGFTTQDEAILWWSAGFAVSAGAGIALQGNGGRQRRAVYYSAYGALLGAGLGLLTESLVGESDAASRYAAAIVGAAVGVAIGGVVGAHGYGDGSPASFSFVVPLFLPGGS